MERALFLCESERWRHEGDKEGRQQQVLETPEHLLICEAYKDIRKTAGDPEAIHKDRASYLRKVIEKRKSLEESLKKGMKV